MVSRFLWGTLAAIRSGQIGPMRPVRPRRHRRPDRARPHIAGFVPSMDGYRVTSQTKPSRRRKRIKL